MSKLPTLLTRAVRAARAVAQKRPYSLGPDNVDVAAILGARLMGGEDFIGDAGRRGNPHAPFASAEDRQAAIEHLAKASYATRVTHGEVPPAAAHTPVSFTAPPSRKEHYGHTAGS